MFRKHALLKRNNRARDLRVASGPKFRRPVTHVRRARLELLERRDLLAASGSFSPWNAPPFEAEMTETGRGVITGVYFSDRNHDRIKDPTEPGVAGATVSLTYSCGATFACVLETESTDGGVFRFDDVPLGNYDLAVIDSPGRRVVSTFDSIQPITSVTQVTSPLTSVAAGLWDADDRPDLFALNPATLQSAKDSVLVFTDQNGSLEAIDEFAVLPDPQWLAVADLDGDGRSDDIIVTGGGVEGKVQVLLNDDEGGLSEALIEVGALPRKAAIGDFDGDGDVDIAVPNANESTITILANDGDGGFSLALTLTSAARPEKIVAQDLDGDSRLDLIVANLGTGSNDGGISVIKNTSESQFIRFGARTDKVLGPPVNEVQSDYFFDTNQDGQVDHTDTPSIAILPIDPAREAKLLVLDGETLEPSQSVVLTDGNGGPTVVYGNASITTTMTKGDFDGDGDLDLAVAATLGGPIRLVPNQQNQNFTETASECGRNCGGQAGIVRQLTITSTDVDEDGNLDFVIVGAFPQITYSRTTPVEIGRLPLSLIRDGQVIDSIEMARPVDVVINSTSDNGDADLDDGIAMTDDGQVTLRAAIEQSNALENSFQIIEFDLPETDSTIPLESPLPTIIKPLLIDAGPPRTDGDPTVQVTGGGTIENGLVFEGLGSTVRGLGLVGFQDASVVAVVNQCLPCADRLRLDHGLIEFVADALNGAEGGGTTDVEVARLVVDSTHLERFEYLDDSGVAIVFGNTPEEVVGKLELETPRTLELIDANPLDLSEVEIQGIDAISLFDPTIQRLVLRDAELASFTKDQPLRVFFGVEDVIQAGVGFEFIGTRLEQGRLIHTFDRGESSVEFAGTRSLLNPVLRFDVDGKGDVTVGDALRVINELARRQYSTPDGTRRELATLNLDFFAFFDPSRDDRITALDALLVINALSRPPDAAGEFVPATWVPNGWGGEWDDEWEGSTTQVPADLQTAKTPSSNHELVFRQYRPEPVDLEVAPEVLEPSVDDSLVTACWAHEVDQRVSLQ